MFLFQPDFSAAVRTLTGLGGALGFTKLQNTSLAANATASLATGATNVGWLTMAAVADASGTVVIQFTDGTNTWTMQTIAAGSTGGQDIVISTNLVFPQFHNNSATVAAHYFVAGALAVQ